MATVITVSNQKGGVGKTTTSAALAAGLAENGKKILGIDLDPQGNFGFCMGSEEHSEATIRDVLLGHTGVQKAIRRVGRYDLLTSDILLGGLGLEFQDTPRKEVLLKEALEPVMEFYDYIIIDTPPALNLLTVNAYGVSDYLIIPMGSDILSLVGLSQLKETFETVRATLNKNLKVLGILLTRYNGRTNLSKDVSEMAEKLSERMATEVFKTRIRSSVAIAEAPAQGESIFSYSPHAAGVRDYVKFIREVKKRIEEDGCNGQEK